MSQIRKKKKKWDSFGCCVVRTVVRDKDRRLEVSTLDRSGGSRGGKK